MEFNTEFKNKLISLQKNYNEIKDQFDDLCDELDKSMSDQQTQEIVSHLTIYLSEMKSIEDKIEQISVTLKRIKEQISN